MTTATPTPAQVLASAPLCKVISIAPATNRMTLDISNLHVLPLSRSVGLIVDPMAARKAIESEPQQVTLLPEGKTYTRFYHYDGWPVISTTGDDSETYIAYRPPENGKPGRWGGYERRRGSDGRQWRRSLGDNVVDDFGFLVEVPR